jgi:hypothetical protein
VTPDVNLDVQPLSVGEGWSPFAGL